MPKRQSLRELYEETRHEPYGDGTERDPEPLAKILIIGVAIVLLTFGIYQGTPFTHGAKRVVHSNADLAEAAFSTQSMIQEFKHPAIVRLAADFRGILTSPDQEGSPAMQAVAQTCLPEDAPSRVMPGPRVIAAHQKAGAYLACAMATQTHRFCYTGERERLIGQLDIYRTNRQKALAYLRQKIALLSDPAAQDLIKMQQRVQGFVVDGKVVMPQMPSLADADIDGEVLTGLATLVENGLMTRSDFGYFGLYLPAEYLSALMTERTHNACG